MARQPDIQYIHFYTDGSAARKVKPVREFEPAQLPKVRRKKRVVVRIDPIAVTGIVLAVVLLCMMFTGIHRLNQVRQQVEQMQAHLETLQAKHAELEAEYMDSYDLEAVEQMALALGMIPAEQVEHIQVQVPAQEAPEEPAGLWERIYTLLTGLLA